MSSNLNELSYNQRFLLGVIKARRQFADESRADAMKAAQIGDTTRAYHLHGEADRHEQQIINAVMGIAHYANLASAA
jgi:hypothetical protein